MIDFSTLATAAVTQSPFPYFTASGVLNDVDLAAITQDFPAINAPGIFPLSSLHTQGAFARLIAELQSPQMTALIGKKFDVDLHDKPLMITVRGHCQRKDGRIHADSKDKIVTCLLYLNDKHWDQKGGRLRFLRNEHDMSATIAEVPPDGGNFVAFKRADNSWHGHEPFEGPRRYIMFNWVQSEATLAKNLGRHKLSAFFKQWRHKTAEQY
ncbi:MAG: 2OG-Fe(II) oxygenase [Alphaproteobacteria bacterium]|nr:2OG-Fe(II) oxygenase [Alphaproteobacteria bacterium]